MKKIISGSLIFLLLLILGIKNLTIFYNNKNNVIDAAAVDTGFISAMDEVDINTVSSKIDQIKKINAENEAVIMQKKKRSESVDNVVEQLDKGIITFNSMFADTVIIGDSLMKAISAYNVLGEDIVIGQVSATLYHLEENIDNLISKHPAIIVIHYGENHIGSSAQSAVDAFTGKYKELVGKLQKALPDTKIVISSIYNPSEDGAKSQSFLANIPMYNEALKKMCDEIGVFYLDNSELLPGDNSYYGSDGIHLTGSFYKEKWLPYLIYKLEL